MKFQTVPVVHACAQIFGSIIQVLLLRLKLTGPAGADSREAHDAHGFILGHRSVT